MVPGAAGEGVAPLDPAPPAPAPASDPPFEPVATPDELAPAPVPFAPDDPEAAPAPEPVPDDVPGVPAPPLPGVVVAPEDPVAAVAPPPEPDPPVSPAVEGPPPLSPEPAADGPAPPEQAIGPTSANNGRNERRCRLVAMFLSSPCERSAPTRPRLNQRPSASCHKIGREEGITEEFRPFSLVLLAGCSPTFPLDLIVATSTPPADGPCGRYGVVEDEYRPPRPPGDSSKNRQQNRRRTNPNDPRMRHCRGDSSLAARRGSGSSPRPRVAPGLPSGHRRR